MPLHDNISAMYNLGTNFFGSPIKTDATFFYTKRWNRFFAIYILRLAL